MGCQCIHGDAFRVHQSQGSLTQVLEWSCIVGGGTRLGDRKQRTPQSSLLVMPLVIASTTSLSILTLELSTSLQ